jgi:hypothetical protein
MKDKYLIDEVALRRILAELERLRQDGCNHQVNIDLLARKPLPQPREA